ncbi:Box C/D snoRNA protein 1 [Mytilus coruscus]|uniref:Box C/D snoRNA protein 1 n=1 Tax=Mytilus coruscus TaxID=42192 RepID=A0A6J8ELI2_MYTCO|nr:Box C/D snoRNA protein 1 [Mytilus coruscus]
MSAEKVLQITDKIKCEVCSECVAKYKCPRCLVGSCSLKCVKQHKTVNDCSGIRDKTAFVEIKQFDDQNLLNDYRFLEEAGRKKDNTTRDELKRKREKPNFLRELHKQAKRRKIDLQIMPYPMDKRKNNATTYNFRSQTILWQIKWIFPKSDGCYIDTRVSEKSIFKDLLKKYIDPTESDPVYRQKLKEYTKKGLDECNLYMKVEGHPANDLRYFMLDKDKSILDNLEGITVVEYPIIYVEFGDCSQYTLMEKGTNG